ncbi:MAG TPA: transposase [Steroidobacteraceae bacterium]|nr:transposase [Steroidobacteraceae bacterium]
MYHVTLRGNHQQDIFLEAEDPHRMNALVAETMDRFGARLHAYCYMSNHIHVLVQIGDVPLGKIMLSIASRYARATQTRLQTTGHFFERRYYSVLVDVEQYFLAVLRYIHLNPVAAGLAASPDAYPWSSHHAYSATRVEPWVTTDFALSLFSTDRMRAIHDYRKFVAQAPMGVPEVSPLDESNPGDRRVLGSDEFVQGLLGAQWKPRSKKSLETLVGEACVHFSCTGAEMASISRKSNLVAARAWVVQQAVAERIASIAAVARRFNRDESSLRHAMKAHALKR